MNPAVWWYPTALSGAARIGGTDAAYFYDLDAEGLEPGEQALQGGLVA